jgi:PLP dependent protein
MTNVEVIATRVHAVLAGLPPGVILVAAAKSRTPDEVRAAIAAGVTHVGHNYVQEAERMIGALGDARAGARWHMIGHLQRNKSKVAAGLFDMVETVDSWALAAEIDRHAAALGKMIPVLLEINSGREPAKSGVHPEDVEALTRRIADLAHVRVEGLMTMGPRSGDPEAARTFFRATRQVYDDLAGLALPHVTMRYLSMGMSNSYEVAVAEGANMVRLGTRLFGPRAEDEG